MVNRACLRICTYRQTDIARIVLLLVMRIQRYADLNRETWTKPTISLRVPISEERQLYNTYIGRAEIKSSH